MLFWLLWQIESYYYLLCISNIFEKYSRVKFLSISESLCVRVFLSQSNSGLHNLYNIHRVFSISAQMNG